MFRTSLDAEYTFKKCILDALAHTNPNIKSSFNHPGTEKLSVGLNFVREIRRFHQNVKNLKKYRNE
jgi:hypothetical protein